MNNNNFTYVTVYLLEILVTVPTKGHCKNLEQLLKYLQSVIAQLKDRCSFLTSRVDYLGQLKKTVLKLRSGLS